MNNLHDLILKSTGADSAVQGEIIQRLWSGYGDIVRYGLMGCDLQSVIVKHVKVIEEQGHPRGWNSDLSHRRKMRSYQIETAWYAHWSRRCDTACRVPACFAVKSLGNELLIVLEDLDAVGFSERRASVNDEEMAACLSWLANFHATFIGEKPKGLWPTGTYWHLETRPEELQALNDAALRNAAVLIDQALRESPYQTIVHGDAKLANFCFSEDGRRVAAVDFQYVGGGCGIKDVAYFIGSCLDEDECQRQESALLDRYFGFLRQALKDQQKSLDADAVEQNWRGLFPVAWADFHRFLKGWSPGHWKINSYSERVARQVVQQLQQ